ncbi:MAG: hypothetical protein V4477_02085 [Pseudomonadota bacterium]
MIELLLATSSLAGLAVGLVGPVWVIVVTTVLVAVMSAVATWSQGFPALAGVAVTTGCLIACQISYMAGRFVTRQYGFPERLFEDEVDGDPGDPRQHGISNDNGKDGMPPSRPPPPKP